MHTYKINFIKHGLIEGNLRGCYIGRTDEPLLTVGVEMLEAQREKYVYPYSERFYCSPLSRCRETLSILYPDCKPVIVPGLTECDFGEFEGKSAEELSQNEAYEKWVGSGDMDACPPGGESTAEFITRVCTAFQDIVKNMMTDGVREATVCTHGGVISAILSAYGLPQQGMNAWSTVAGKGFRILINPTVWMRGGMFEVIGLFPFEHEEALDRDDEE